MTAKELVGLDVNVFYEQLDNGLDIYLVPFNNRNNYYIEYAVKYGANINEFVSKKTNKRVKMPYGIAHFLEHKMFEQEDGVDPFAFYSESGTDANASTSYNVTSYTLEGTKNIEENLDYLLNYVNSPYFTEQNVEKEKGIIIEEINMYKDQPESVLYNESSKAFFQKHPMREDVGGTEKSVKKITKEMLYECYDAFYQPNNMFLVVGGNFDKDKVLKVIKNNKKLNERKRSDNPIVFNTKEPLLVNKKEKELFIKTLVLPKFVFSIKSPIKNLKGQEKYKYMLSIEILLYILFGPSSEFKESIFKNELASLFYTSSDVVDDILMVEFIAESKDPYKLKDQIIKNLQEQELLKEDIERAKKAKISLEVIESDVPYRVISALVNHILDFDEIVYNKVDIIRNITYEDIIRVRNNILIDNNSFVVAFPKQKKTSK